MQSSHEISDNMGALFGAMRQCSNQVMQCSLMSTSPYRSLAAKNEHTVLLLKKKVHIGIILQALT